MKFVLSFLFLVPTYSFACSCAEYPMDHWPAIENYIQGKYDMYAKLDDKDIDWIAYHPGFGERMFWSTVRGTSCEGEGPNGEIMAHCATSRKSDYRVRLNRRKCELVLRVKSTVSKISVKELKSTCGR